MSRAVGAAGESEARAYLEEKEYQILETNFRTSFGEIDLIVLKEEILIFVEVKTRKSKAFGLPREAVNFKKQQKYYRLAQAYLQRHPQLQQQPRFDVIEVYYSKGQCRIEHIINAF